MGWLSRKAFFKVRSSHFWQYIKHVSSWYARQVTFPIDICCHCWWSLQGCIFIRTWIIISFSILKFMKEVCYFFAMIIIFIELLRYTIQSFLLRFYWIASRDFWLFICHFEQLFGFWRWLDRRHVLTISDEIINTLLIIWDV